MEKSKIESIRHNLQEIKKALEEIRLKYPSEEGRCQRGIVNVEMIEDSLTMTEEYAELLNDRANLDTLIEVSIKESKWNNFLGIALNRQRFEQALQVLIAWQSNHVQSSWNAWIESLRK